MYTHPVADGDDRLVSVDFGGIFAAQLCMAFTFGLFHLVFAACTWPRQQASPAPVLES
jgi:hypothetical protein